jgi:PA-IL-like protein
MTAVNWQAMDGKTALKIPAKPDRGIWTPVRAYLSGPSIIRIAAEGTWKPVDIFPACTADGLRHWAVSRDMLLTKKAPLGALIGKIGGSNIAADDSDIFVVGSNLVLTVDKQTGPLWLTINDAPAFFDDNSGELTVNIA